MLQVVELSPGRPRVSKAFMAMLRGIELVGQYDSELGIAASDFRSSYRQADPTEEESTISQSLVTYTS